MVTNIANDFDKYIGLYLKYYENIDGENVEVNKEYVNTRKQDFKEKIGKIEKIGLDDYLIRVNVDNCDESIFISFNENFEIFNKQEIQ